MQTVDRDSYLLWKQGIFISVNADNGVKMITDEKNCIAADEALERGEIIALLQDGALVSYVIPEDDCHHFQEILRSKVRL